MDAALYSTIVQARRPAVWPLQSTQVLPRVIATAPVAQPTFQLYADPSPAAPVPPAIDVQWRWSATDRLLLPLAWLLATRHRAPGRHRRHDGPVRSHRAGGVR